MCGKLPYLQVLNNSPCQYSMGYPMISIPTYLSNSYFLFQVFPPVNFRFHQDLISRYYYLFLFITDADKDSDPYICVLCPPLCLSQGHSLVM